MPLLVMFAVRSPPICNEPLLLFVIAPLLAVPDVAKFPLLEKVPFNIEADNVAVPLLVMFAVRSPPICNDPLLLFVIAPLLEVPDVAKFPLLEKVPFNVADDNVAVPLLVIFAVRSPPICNEPLLLFVIAPLLAVPDVAKFPLLEKGSTQCSG